MGRVISIGGFKLKHLQGQTGTIINEDGWRGCWQAKAHRPALKGTAAGLLQSIATVEERQASRSWESPNVGSKYRLFFSILYLPALLQKLF